MAIVGWPRRSWTTRGWTPRSRAGVEVHVGPAQAEPLAPAHAGGGEDDPEGVQAVVGQAGPLDEPSQGRGVPGLKVAGLLAGPGRVRRVGRVPGQPAPPDGVLER